MSMVKNGLYEGVAEALGSAGEAIIKTEGTTAFVPFCLVGERVKFRALKITDGGKAAYGKAEEISDFSPDRTEPPCPLFKKCGGCDLQHMKYSAQLAFKRELVASTLRKIGGISLSVEPVTACRAEYRYRNKVALPIGTDDGGNTVLGFYARRSHRIVSADDCLIQAEWIKEVISAVKKYSRVTGYRGYDERTREGELRQIVVREIKGKFIVALVVTKRIDAEVLLKELEKIFKDFTFLLNINNSTGNVIFSDKWLVCRGEGRFEAEENGITYSAGAETFVQVNDDVRNKLYSRVLAEAGADCEAVDLYSGGGLLTAMLAKACKRAYGVEAVREASLCADELCERNGLKGKMINVCGRVEDKLDGVLSATDGKKIIVCDPPRKGMERSVAEKLGETDADKIILISCNPATLARDLKIITECSKGRFEAASVTPFDMFPQTRHVETLVVLENKNR